MTTEQTTKQVAGSPIDPEPKVQEGPPPLNVFSSVGEIPAGFKTINVQLMPSVPMVVPEQVQVAWGQDGNLYHAIEVTPNALGAEKEWEWRRLALTMDEAREKRIDFYHPTLGLIWHGFKLARDRTPQDIMADRSIGGLVPPGELPVQKAGYAPNAEPAHD